MSEQSRLGRESIEGAWTFEQITDVGSAGSSISKAESGRLEAAVNAAMLHLVNSAAEMEREKASQRVYDGSGSAWGSAMSPARHPTDRARSRRR